MGANAQHSQGFQEVLDELIKKRCTLGKVIKTSLDRNDLEVIEICVQQGMALDIAIDTLIKAKGEA